MNQKEFMGDLNVPLLELTYALVKEHLFGEEAKQKQKTYQQEYVRRVLE